MLDISWIPASSWDAQPSKKRRVTIEDLEQGLLRLSLSTLPTPSRERLCADAGELPTLLRSLTLQNPPAAPYGSTAPRDYISKDEVHRREKEMCRATDMHILDHAGADAKCTDIVVFPDEGGVESKGRSATCTAIVPHRKAPRQQRWRRIPRIATIPSPISLAPIAKFAVDSQGTAFVLPETVRSEIARARDRYKRSLVEEQTHVTTTAIVIYQKPRKHDLVQDFMTLKL
jgi:hypothetical protein